MRVAVDVSIQELEHPTGVERAQAVLLDALLRSDADLELVLLARRRVPERWRDDPRVHCAEGAGGPIWLWRETAVPRALREFGAQIVHSPVAALPLRARCPMIATVHEVPWAEDAPVEGADERAAHKLRLHLAANFAARIVVPSERTAAAVLREHPDAERLLRVVPHGTAPVFTDVGFARIVAGAASDASAAQAAIDAACAALGVARGRYVLAVGRLRTKKNLALLLEAFALLRGADSPRASASADVATPGREGHGSDAVRPDTLLLVGPDGDASEVIAARAVRPDLDGCVVRAGFVDDVRLAALYRGAAAVAFPSRFEGFGLPVLEAMASGVPTIVAAGGAADALVREAARVVSGDEASAWASALREVCAPGEARTALVAAGRARAAEFDAARAASSMLAIYGELS